MTEVKEAILKEISVLECSWSSPKGPSTMSTTLLANTSGRDMPPPHQGTNKSACVFCKGLHFLGRCETVRDTQKRLEISLIRNYVINKNGVVRGGTRALNQWRNCVTLWISLSTRKKANL